MATATTTTTTMTNNNNDDDDKGVIITTTTNKKKLTAATTSRQQSSGMESSVLKFHNINFTVAGKNKGDPPRYLLKDVNGKIRWGHTLAIMGPSGAGKTTLISTLTLEALYGKPSGSVTLNGVRMTDSLFKKHCYVVKQHDKHWPYLTCRETLLYAAELYQIADTQEDMIAIVEEIIVKMGLSVCADTKCGQLSGGEQRRLSIGVALLKQPTVLFLDEPTSGLDAAAADNIMKEIVRVAKEERIIIICTIHQPSTKVYDSFDKVMILSKGRLAYSGDRTDAPKYFESIGHPIPERMNPAEHFLDIVNADFSSEQVVDKILDAWEERDLSGTRSEGSYSEKEQDENDDVQEGVVSGPKRDKFKATKKMFQRHATIIARDPLLYVGRAVVFLLLNTVFGFVYWSARDAHQSQALNKHFLNLWYCGIATNVGAVAVYALNDEFKSVLRESKNGMIGPYSYAMAKTVLVLPIIYIFSIFALGIPGFVVQDFPASTFGRGTVLWSATFYCFECLAECLAVWIEDPIFGMLQFISCWFLGFCFSGMFLDHNMLYYPFALLFYIDPFSYYLRSAAYTYMHAIEWDKCEGGLESGQPVCVASGDPIEVLNSISTVYSVVDGEETFERDLGVLVAIAVFLKTVFFIGVGYKTSRVTKINK